MSTTEYIIGQLEMFALAAERDPKAPKGVWNTYREWAQTLRNGGSVTDLPPLGQRTVAVIEEGKP